ncbi:hypothetical protein AVEN_168992-1 [Araneus ventricosus]|uniref:Uncharacterized protein n=1 Tax=Araneus ventricosus TaxID=182803 RepID=A0A4Y2KDJ1_ARAVE|nr:hypothetical protein AVEN_168992-1 [Araneus ventricosus]
MIPHLIVRSRTQLTKDNIVFLPPEVVIEKHFQKAKPFDLSVANDGSSIMTTWEDEAEMLFDSKILAGWGLERIKNVTIGINNLWYWKAMASLWCRILNYGPTLLN